VARNEATGDHAIDGSRHEPDRVGGEGQQGADPVQVFETRLSGNVSDVLT
jgi:hypothetical protein